MIPQLLLLTGAPASGKTQLARRLLERYGACGCSKDEIKELLFDHLGERDAAWSGRLSDASFALLFAFAPRLLSGRRLLVMEGNFRSGEHELALAAVLWGRRVRARGNLTLAAFAYGLPVLPVLLTLLVLADTYL